MRRNCIGLRWFCGRTTVADIDPEALALAHLQCQPGECDPTEAALSAHLPDRQTVALIRAIEGYHHPEVRILVAATRRLLG